MERYPTHNRLQWLFACSPDERTLRWNDDDERESADLGWGGLINEGYNHRRFHRGNYLTETNLVAVDWMLNGTRYWILRAKYEREAYVYLGNGLQTMYLLNLEEGSLVHTLDSVSIAPIPSRMETPGSPYAEENNVSRLLHQIRSDHSLMKALREPRESRPADMKGYGWGAPKPEGPINRPTFTANALRDVYNIALLATHSEGKRPSAREGAWTYPLKHAVCSYNVVPTYWDKVETGEKGCEWVRLLRDAYTEPYMRPACAAGLLPAREKGHYKWTVDDIRNWNLWIEPVQPAS